MNFPRLFVLSIALLTTCSVLRAQLTSAQIDELTEDALTKLKVAGAAVAVVKDGQIIHNKGYGVKSITSKKKVDQHTQFAIASNSKAFTTAALAILVDEGKLKWTDQVIQHIPEFQMYNAYVTENFNIQDLLTHRSGLGLGIGDLMIFPDGSDFTIDDILASFQHFKPVSAFRTQFDYDNLLYLVAGEVIARISGMSWESFIQQKIFDPLQMERSAPSLSLVKDKNNLALPHSTSSGTMRVLPNYEDMINGAAGGIYANVDDICNWMLVQLNEGKYGEGGSQQLFSERQQKEMWSIHTPTSAGRNPRYNSHFAGYGLGWDLEDKKGNMIVSHTGGLPGMLSRTVLIPDLELGIVVLTNTEIGGAGVFGSVSRSIVDSYLGLDDFGWTDKFANYFDSRASEADSIVQKVWATVAQTDQSCIVENDYLGVYEDKWFGKVEVLRKDGQLWFRCYRSPKLNGPMSYYKANTFAIKWEYQDMNADAFAIFSLDEEGKAQSIKMKGISPDIDFSFDFHDLDLHRIEEEKE